jgi:hypothetical protein
LNDLAGDTQCQLKETCEDVVACSVAIDGSADVTDFDHIALFIQVVNENFPYKSGPQRKEKHVVLKCFLMWRIF